MLWLDRREFDDLVAVLNRAVRRCRNANGVLVPPPDSGGIPMDARAPGIIAALMGAPVVVAGTTFALPDGTFVGEPQPMVQVQIPEWRSHKVVRAEQVTGILEGPLRWFLRGGVIVQVSDELAARVTAGTPYGGYYVKYSDGFESWSPQAAFEDGYTRIEPNACSAGSTG